MGSKLEPGKYDCHAKARADEPLFTLLARDPHAPFLVRMWAELRRMYPKSLNDQEEREKIAEALHCAKSMEDWKVNWERRGRR